MVAIPKSCGPYLIIDPNNLPPVKSSNSSVVEGTYSFLSVFILLAAIVILITLKTERGPKR